MSGSTSEILPNLIYEMVEGKPVYYQGYKDYLKGKKQIEELMGSSKLQSLIISKIIRLLYNFYNDDYLIFTNELGIQFSNKSWRAADIAVIKSDKVKKIDNKYLKVAPELVIEIDTKAELQEVKNPLGYYHEKTDELLRFGVEKVVWIFTDSKKIMIAEQNKKWMTSDWNEDVEITDGLVLNLAQFFIK